MDTLIYQRRFWGRTIAPLCIFFLARFLFIAGMSYHDFNYKFRAPGKVSAPFKASAPSHAIPAAPLPMDATTPVQIMQEQPIPADSFLLRSGLHEFHYIFSGQVTCGNTPCAADLHISLQSDHNEDLKQIVSTGPDGRFACKMTFRENLHQSLDWRVMVYTPNTYPVELRGRQILMDDDDLIIEKAIQLP
jgi:hypothetical protein